MCQPYNKPGAKRRYKCPPWRWKHTKKGCYYELIGSEQGRKYTCYEYLYYKLNGIVPYKDLVIGGAPTSATVEDWLKKEGYTHCATVPCGGPAPQQCGCKPKQWTNCVVLYRDIESGVVFHVAVFDPQTCDWGGKLSANGPIVRFTDPGEYCKFLDPAERAKTEMVFYCKAQAAATYLSDDAISKGGRRNGHKEDRKPWGWFEWFFWGIVVLVTALLALSGR